MSIKKFKIPARQTLSVIAAKLPDGAIETFVHCTNDYTDPCAVNAWFETVTGDQGAELVKPWEVPNFDSGNSTYCKMVSMDERNTYLRQVEIAARANEPLPAEPTPQPLINNEVMATTKQFEGAFELIVDTSLTIAGPSNKIFYKWLNNSETDHF